MASTTRSKKAERTQATQEDIKHLLEEVWDCDTQDTFYKTFAREAKKGTNLIVNLEKKDLEELSWKEGDKVDYLKKGEVGLIRMIDHCKNHLTANKQFPSDEGTCRHNTITQEA